MLFGFLGGFPGRLEEVFEGGEGFRADMVLDAFGINPGGGRGNAKGLKKSDDFAVPGLGSCGEAATLGGEKN